MIDKQDAVVVEVLLDDTGKLWVNVDEQCVLRIGFCAEIRIEQPTKDGTTIGTHSYKRPAHEGEEYANVQGKN